MKIGVLAIQGNFIDHINLLKKSEIPVLPIEIRYKDQIKQCDALIIPGGESTTIGILCEKYGLINSLKEFVKTKPVWGICAGAILLSNKIQNMQKLGSESHLQPILGGLSITTIRNYFGPQINSSSQTLKLDPNFQHLQSKQMFIRAPIFTEIGKDVEVIAEVDWRGKKLVAAVQQNNLLATCFHPELNNDLSWHYHFLSIINSSLPVPIPSKIQDSFKAYVIPEVQLQPFISNSLQNEIILMNKTPDNIFHNLQRIKESFPRFLQGGVIMDVVNAEQARIAEAAGACCVMALERIPADIKQDGGIARMSDPQLIKSIQQAVTIPVMAKSRIGHFGESKILESLQVDCIDESEVLTPADKLHIDKWPFKVPFVCGARDLGEALRRIAEGAAMIRIKGDAGSNIFKIGTGNVVNAVEHCRAIFGSIRQLSSMLPEEIYNFAKVHMVPLNLVKQVRDIKRLPVVTFAAGGIATPADVILMMQMGCDGVFVGSGIFKSSDPEIRAKAIVSSCTYFQDPAIVAKVSENLGKPMVGILQKGEEYSFVQPKL